ncbi:MAG: putative peptidoglycan binding domain [Miltoncostaeaceae bacterium]|jgi:peptidoglycan hydrolase-like protein with peptidoglycan-binding domain|nr:putative peptidoglycan binding domain [Miltoncostaeaceae bacterium]
MHAATAPSPVLASAVRSARVPCRPAPAAGYRELLAAELPALPARTVQLLLVALGHLAPGAASGRFDRATAAAVRAFQVTAGLEATGVPARATADALLARTG